MSQKRCKDCIYWDNNRCEIYGCENPNGFCDKHYKNIVLVIRDELKKQNDLTEEKKKKEIFFSFCDRVINDDSHILYDLWNRNDIYPEIDRNKFDGLMEEVILFSLIKGGV